MRGDSVPSEDIDAFIDISRKYLAGAYTKIALCPLTAHQEAEMWALIRGVEAAMKMRGVSIEPELEAIDRELERLNAGPVPKLLLRRHSPPWTQQRSVTELFHPSTPP
jgi:hypothetical protein